MRKVHLGALLLLATACGRGEPATPSVITPMEATFAAQHTWLVGDNPPALSLELRVDNEQARFRLGEPIPLVITFSGTGAHEVSVHNYDRSGRMWSETFVAAPPDDATDPLATYFGERKGGRGGISPMPKPLQDGPVEIPLTLNEWIRFDRPGTHRLFVTSTRTGQPATTNIITIEVEDDPAWVTAELARIRSVVTEHRDSEEAAAAFRSLRFLGTKAAADEIVAQLCIEGENYVSPLHFGAFGAKDRQHMIAALEAGLAKPSCAVSGQYLRTLTKLKIPPAPMTADWADVYARTLSPSVKALDAALDSKTPRARAVSTHAVLARMREHEQRAGRVDPAAAARRAELASVFDKLPDEARARVLADEWLTVRSPDLAPVLAGIVKRAQSRGGRLRSLSDLALERWIDLEPEPARAFIIAELSRPTGARVSFDAKTLGLLPDTDLPDLDAALIAGARATTTGGQPVSDGATLELRAEIIARYASPAVVTEVWELYRASTYFRMSLLTYLVRVDSEAAKEIIATLSLSDVQRLAEIRWSRALQDATVAYLGQAEPNRADSAAALLATHADATVLPALWKRIESIEAIKLTEGTPEANLHARIRQSIATAKGWTITKQGLERLGPLCVEQRCRDDVESYIQRWNDGKPAFVLWSHAANGEVSGWIGQYGVHSVAELKQKMHQLPRGTVLVWGTKPGDVDDAVLAQVSGWAKERGVTLQRPAPAAVSP